ncbi:RNA polymerase sigma-70 factor [Egibacter rhizosphaerae]|uniref:RNA polymerase sigma-70 factor n=1 Tax=Egibacter rhizosphaerae TaxID=1670831 RepID=A0A411YFC2_9ACTN|nr:RNA polymerase sigma factor SigJ [Egibacter rhizosphaerae]QBI19871.1 RNA polymerase sigma-70 factor [Egibacter rhizosphaerae]
MSRVDREVDRERTEPAGAADAAAVHERLVRDEQDRLFGLAYRMLGSVAEAEDAVGEAYLRWSRIDTTQIDEPAAWLTTVVTRICVDRLRSAQRQRETYVGSWLPEPVATAVDPADAASTADSLSIAFLILLEALSPLERAAFLLHDVFGYAHDEVAAMLDRKPAAVRQLVRRARDHVASRSHRYETDPDRQREVVEAFQVACGDGDLEAMMELLAPDVAFVGDGGGVVPAVPAPIVGAERVAKLVRGLYVTGERKGLRSQPMEVNAAPAVWVREPDGSTSSVLVFEVTDGRVSAIRGIRNPAKLAAFPNRRPEDTTA